MNNRTTSHQSNDNTRVTKMSVEHRSVLRVCVITQRIHKRTPHNVYRHVQRWTYMCAYTYKMCDETARHLKEPKKQRGASSRAEAPGCEEGVREEEIEEAPKRGKRSRPPGGPTPSIAAAEVGTWSHKRWQLYWPCI